MQTLESKLEELGIDLERFLKSYRGRGGVPKDVQQARKLIAQELFDAGLDWGDISSYMRMSHGSWSGYVEGVHGKARKKKRASLLIENCHSEEGVRNRAEALRNSESAKTVRARIAYEIMGTDRVREACRRVATKRFSNNSERTAASNRMKKLWRSEDYRVTMLDAANTPASKLKRAINAIKQLESKPTCYPYFSEAMFERLDLLKIFIRTSFCFTS